jgi:predicted lipoprotein with Yx(FWY)xxD motif
MHKTAETPKGKTFVDGKGMTLYTFDKDAGGKSMCNGPCAENWPPLLAADDAKPTADMTIVARDDGKKMWAYKGKPLCTFKKDAASKRMPLQKGCRARRDQQRRFSQRRMADGEAMIVGSMEH